ncbi:elongation factor TU family protein [Cavenderia fasciculata]|uniref:Elongation factor TU family protein n=1 Tax=Cavenderia fasciculata TaxID=261658 RepID=F4PSE4_CACFS|nr:elongation factor TU family protein [Cavenderia fasciculata]EGG21474.1 elongation factor TU family protein [Cavenderia fasciculata]|eukprot:XP_004359324.1 elongation factor TU family protein [Cavenderia fasciculata]
MMQSTLNRVGSRCLNSYVTKGGLTSNLTKLTTTSTLSKTTSSSSSSTSTSTTSSSYNYNRTMMTMSTSMFNNNFKIIDRSYATAPTTHDIQKIRNVAIIAHVDHGKTSMVDQLLRQSGTLKDTQNERVMDSNALEKERGITIMAKNTSLNFKDYKLNIVDTPGHGDFGGEVERVLSMVDGVVLLVDATEGVMAQTKFVLSKALAAGLRPIVVINKMDRTTIRVDEVENEIFDLFATLGATDDQMGYPTLYASARMGWAVRSRGDDQKGITPILDTIIEYVHAPKVEVDKPFSMLVTNLETDPFLGRIVTGKQRLIKELESNVSMQVQFQGEGAFEVKGRGELQLGILLENMRREGFEVAVSQPRVVFKKEQDGSILEPQEEVIIDVDAEFSGLIIEKMSKRKGDLLEMKQSMGKSRLVFLVPSRGLIGLRSELVNDTKGTGVFNHLFHSYIPHKGPMGNNDKGAIISISEGITTMHALSSIEDRGILFVGAQVQVYEGMIIGEHSKAGDLDVNPVKTKHLTNMRTTVKEEGIRLAPPRPLKLEEAIAAVRDDELIEITPKSIRLRKRELETGKRLKATKDKKAHGQRA